MGQPSQYGPRTFQSRRSPSLSRMNRPLRVPTSTIAFDISETSWGGRDGSYGFRCHAVRCVALTHEESARGDRRHPPVPRAEQPHQRGHEQRTDDGRVEDDPGGETDAELLDVDARALL